MNAATTYFEKLLQALSIAYREKEKIEVGNQWQRDVMGRIRDIGPIQARSTYLFEFEQLVWRFAPVACAIIVVLAVGIIQFDFTAEYELANIFFDHSIELTALEFIEAM
jgi:hypothetical protein